MNVVSKWLRALRASPFALTFALGELILWVMALPVAALADLLIWIWKQLPEAEAETETLLIRDLENSEGWVSRLIKTALTENQYSALTSFTFNVGAGALQRSTLRMKLNRGEYQGAADEFPKWRIAGGRILAGLVRRRAAERSLFLT